MKNIIDRAFEEADASLQNRQTRRRNRFRAQPVWPRRGNSRAGREAACLKNDRIGGLLRYGIPNFKMEKHLIDRRMRQMEAEGVRFVANAHVGKMSRWMSPLSSTAAAHRRREWSRDLKVPGREFRGHSLRMEFLLQQTGVVRRQGPPRAPSSHGKASSSSAAVTLALIAWARRTAEGARSTSSS